MNLPAYYSQSIWQDTNNPDIINVLDQRKLPHLVEVIQLKTHQEVVQAIQEMVVRGAPVIGVCAAYGMYLAAKEAAKESTSFEVFINKAAAALLASRPTAVNLAWAIHKQLSAMSDKDTLSDKIKAAYDGAQNIVDEDVENCKAIGKFGLGLFKNLLKNKADKQLNILTHCNAGRLACVSYGTATAPIYYAQEAGLPIHIWVDETRPRNQGFNLTAWELSLAKVPHSLIVDNAGGHLMQHKKVDIVIVGADRITKNGDVANKIGTYLKALAAADNNIPFYVAAPSSSIDFNMENGIENIPIEKRSADEVKYITGWDGTRDISVRIATVDSPVSNYGFDVTPARLISGIITERGICAATKEGLCSLFPEKF